MSQPTHDERSQEMIRAAIRIRPEPRVSRRSLAAEMSDSSYWIGWALAVWFMAAAWKQDWERFSGLVGVVTFGGWMLWQGIIVETHSPLQKAAVVFMTMIALWALMSRFM